MTDTIWVAIIGGIIGPIIVLTSKWYLDNKLGKKKRDMVTDALEVGEQVTTKLDQIREDYEADRVWISQFHNGGHFYPTGKSIAKFSIFYETVTPSASSLQLTLKNIPVALFSKSFNELSNEGAIVISDFEDETIATFGLKYFAAEYGTKSQYLFAIKNFEGKFIAIMGVDYTTNKHRLKAKEIEDLIHTSIALGGVLSNHLKS
jgi:hypothetical protein